MKKLDFDIKLMLDYINRFGGYREKDIIKNVKSITIIMDTEEHRVYKIESLEGNTFEYDVITNKIVG